MNVTLTLTAKLHREIRAHLFPGDGLEAVAILLCGRRAGADTHRLLVQKVIPIAHGECERRHDFIRWPTTALPAILQEANASSLSVIKIHGHQASCPFFSTLDDQSDRELVSSLPGWMDADYPHGSAIMLDDGRLLGRYFDAALMPRPFERIVTIGDDVRFFFEAAADGDIMPFADRHARAFGKATSTLLSRLRIAVVGCSGTGSPLIEQLVRLGVGEIVLVDPDVVKVENLNRIIHATTKDIGRLKVDVAGDAIEAAGLGTRVIRIPMFVSERSVVEAIAESDFVFGCMDGAEGRNLVNRIATFYLVPYIDLGVRLSADGAGEIEEVSGAVHYLQPGKSSLVTRGVITTEQVRADSLRRTNPAEYERLRTERYIIGANETRPAVISVNFFVAAMGVNDLLARLHDYRSDGNSQYAEWRVSLSHIAFYPGQEGRPSTALRRYVGAGDVEPRLDMPELSRPVQ